MDVSAGQHSCVVAPTVAYEDVMSLVNSCAVDNVVVDMQLSVMSEEMLNSATFEDEAVNDDLNTDSAATAGDVMLQLTVYDDPVYDNSSLILPVTMDSVLAKPNVCLTECQRNLSSSVSEKISSGTTMSRQTVSDVSAAQADVFRQYLLNGDMQARILELDNASVQQVCIKQLVHRWRLYLSRILYCVHSTQYRHLVLFLIFVDKRHWFKELKYMTLKNKTSLLLQKLDDLEAVLSLC